MTTTKTLPVLDKNLLYLFIACVLVATGGCVSTEVALKRDAAVNAESSYVYGKFHIDGDGSTASSYNIALKLLHKIHQNSATEKYIGFETENDIYAVEVPAGDYEFGSVVYMSDVGKVFFEKKLNPESPIIKLHLQAGKAYYLGDYIGETSYTSGVTQYTIRWQLKSLKDKFGTTTKAFTDKYQKFNSIEKVNLVASFKEQLFSQLISELRRLDDLIRDEKYDEAVSLAKKHAMEKKVPYAQVRLGYLYEHGYGLAKSNVDAGNWYKKAADQGYSEGMFRLGVLLLRNAKSLDKDPKWSSIGTLADGFIWIRRAAVKGSSRAMGLYCSFSTNPTYGAALLVEGFAWCNIAVDKLRGDASQKALFDKIQSMYRTAQNKLPDDIKTKALKQKEAILSEMSESKSSL
ncbi:MAG: tetratricopeptide repeat protein [Gammaproteobacteria bacterium]|jgi:TPR repeat protein